MALVFMWIPIGIVLFIDFLNVHGLLVETINEPKFLLFEVTCLLLYNLQTLLGLLDLPPPLETQLPQLVLPENPDILLGLILLIQYVAAVPILLLHLGLLIPPVLLLVRPGHLPQFVRFVDFLQQHLVLDLA